MTKNKANLMSNDELIQKIEEIERLDKEPINQIVNKFFELSKSGQEEFLRSLLDDHYESIAINASNPESNYSSNAARQAMERILHNLNTK